MAVWKIQKPLAVFGFDEKKYGNRFLVYRRGRVDMQEITPGKYITKLMNASPFPRIYVEVPDGEIPGDKNSTLSPDQTPGW